MNFKFRMTKQINDCYLFHFQVFLPRISLSLRYILTLIQPFSYLLTNMYVYCILQEQWHVYWCEHHNQYTMYINLPGRYVLASNWREAGVHNRKSFNSKDFPTLDYCAIQLQEFPKDLKKFGWDALEEKDGHHWRDEFSHG